MAVKYFYTGSDKHRRNKITPFQVGSIAQGNRHTGKPHENKREIDRTLTQKGHRLFLQDIRTA